MKEKQTESKRSIKKVSKKIAQIEKSTRGPASESQPHTSPYIRDNLSAVINLELLFEINRFLNTIGKNLIFSLEIAQLKDKHARIVAYTQQAQLMDAQSVIEEIQNLEKDYKEILEGMRVATLNTKQYEKAREQLGDLPNLVEDNINSVQIERKSELGKEKEILAARYQDILNDLHRNDLEKSEHALYMLLADIAVLKLKIEAQSPSTQDISPVSNLIQKNEPVSLPELNKENNESLAKPDIEPVSNSLEENEPVSSPELNEKNNESLAKPETEVLRIKWTDLSITILDNQTKIKGMYDKLLSMHPMPDSKEEALLNEIKQSLEKSQKINPHLELLERMSAALQLIKTNEDQTQWQNYMLIIKNKYHHSLRTDLESIVKSTTRNCKEKLVNPSILNWIFTEIIRPLCTLVGIGFRPSFYMSEPLRQEIISLNHSIQAMIVASTQALDEPEHNSIKAQA